MTLTTIKTYNYVIVREEQNYSVNHSRKSCGKAYNNAGRAR